MKFKKLTALLMAFCMMGMGMTVLSVNADYYILNNHKDVLTSKRVPDVAFTYENDRTTVTIVAGNDSAEEIEIPSEIRGLPVTAIADYAFSQCTKLKSITIPDTVTKIGNYAFAKTALTSVTIPESVTEIGHCAFSGCSELKEISIPETITSIGSEPFTETPWLADRQAEQPLVVVNGILIDGTTCTGDIVIPDTVTVINGDSFSENQGITSVIIPDTVTTTGIRAFSECRNLQSVTFSENMEEISFMSFCACDSLTEVTIPENIGKIGADAFKVCANLQCITIENPDCIFERSVVTNGEDYEKPYPDVDWLLIHPYYNGVIRGYENSTAQAYAEEMGYTFESLGEIPALEAGDLDGDNEITISDVILINRAIFGKTTLTKAQRNAADINGNGIPDAEDSLEMMKYIVKLIDTLA